MIIIDTTIWIDFFAGNPESHVSYLEELLRNAKCWAKHPSKVGLILNEHQSTIRFHLKKLIDMNIVTSFEIINTKKYFLTNPEDIYYLIISYKKSLLGAANGRFLIWLEIYYYLIINKVENNMYRIFPHPYHC